MNLSDLMEGLREAQKEQTKFCGITLTQKEIGPILAEYDQLKEMAREKMGCLNTADLLAANAQFGPLDETVMKQQAEIERLTGRTMRLAAQVGEQQGEVERLRALVQCLLDNDPDDYAADGVTVLQVWRKQAREALNTRNLEDPTCTN